MGRGRDGESPGSARDAPVDVFAQAEALNDLSKTYDVEIDGVPLQRMSTTELSKLAARERETSRDARRGGTAVLPLGAPRRDARADERRGDVRGHERL